MTKSPLPHKKTPLVMVSKKVILKLWMYLEGSTVNFRLPHVYSPRWVSCAIASLYCIITSEQQVNVAIPVSNFVYFTSDNRNHTYNEKCIISTTI